MRISSAQGSVRRGPLAFEDPQIFMILFTMFPQMDSVPTGFEVTQLLQMKSQSAYPFLSRPHRSQTGSSWEADGKDPQEQRSLPKNSLFCEHEAELTSHQGVFVGLIKTEIKKKVFVPMHARVTLVLGTCGWVPP